MAKPVFLNYLILSQMSCFSGPIHCLRVLVRQGGYKWRTANISRCISASCYWAGASLVTNAHPYVSATGTSSAFLGDERLLREFVVGDKVQRARIEAGQNAILYLINDSYDGLSEGQCRLAVNKDKQLMEQWRRYIGHPIAEVPDPFGCHGSLADHYIHALLTRLRALDIHPVVIDSYRAYRNGDYDPYINITLAHYHDIQAAIAKHFPQFGMRNLFRMQCPVCARIDRCDITHADSDTVAYSCGACGSVAQTERSQLKGKLSWKLDCAARWNMYGIHAEAFSKSHTSQLGSYEVSGFISRHFFGGNVPEAVRYGELRLDKDIAYRLIEILPPKMFKRLLLENTERDLELNKASIEHYCRRVEVAPGLSYVDFVKRELPLLAISKAKKPESLQQTCIHTQELLEFGNRFSGFFFHQEHDISLAGAQAIPTASIEVAQAAEAILTYTLEMRRSADYNEEEKQAMLVAFLQSRQSVAGVFPYLRKVFAQQQGPGIASLLQTLPLDYLDVMRMAVGYYIVQSNQTRSPPHT